MPLPAEQLKLYDSEVLRQRDENARRPPNVHSRAAILIVASGIVIGLQVKDLSHGWGAIAVLLALLAAGCGMWTFRPVTADEPADTLQSLANIGVDTYSLEYRIVHDNVVALVSGRAILGSKAKWVQCGFGSKMITESYFPQEIETRDD